MKRFGWLGFVAAVVLAAALGGMFGPSAWFVALQKPSWNPPGWVFGPVWTLLYVLIAAAGVRVWRSTGAERTKLVGLWAMQMLFNALWSPLFFGAKRPALAFVDIVALLTTIVAFIAVAQRGERKAALLFLPYAAWVAFATALNFAILQLN
jgi:translocator protein